MDEDLFDAFNSKNTDNKSKPKKRIRDNQNGVNKEVEDVTEVKKRRIE